MTMGWLATSVKRLLKGPATGNGTADPTVGAAPAIAAGRDGDGRPDGGPERVDGADRPRDHGRLTAHDIIGLFQDEEPAPEADTPVTLTPVGAVPAAATPEATKLAMLSRIFTPSQPKRVRTDFAGRRNQLANIVAAIEDQRSHVVLFAHRGLGKTSLANVVGTEARRSGYQVIRYACSAETTYASLFRSIIPKIPQELIDNTGQQTRRGLPPQLMPSDVIDFCSRVTQGRLLIIIDDLDAIRDDTFHRALVETMKGVSDVGAPLTFLVLGVAHDLEALLGEDGRIERNIVAVHLPHMTQRELQSIIDWGLDLCGMSIEPDMRQLAAMLSRGLPFVTGFLCLHAGCAAVRAGKDVIGTQELAFALRRFVDQVDPRVVEAYRRVTRAESHAFMVDVLFAAAAARMDDYGRFTIRDAASIPRDDGRKPLTEAVVARVFDTLCEDDGVMERHTTSLQEVSFGFRSELMRPYVVIRQSLKYGLFEPADAGADSGAA